MEACAALQSLYPDRALTRWTHTLRFRGHFSTKSRRYSTTPGESVLAATIARDIQLNRQTAREALHDQLALQGAVS